MGKVSLALAGLFLSLGCSRPANIDNSGGQNNGAKLEAKLATAASYPSGTTQTIVINVAKLDDSKGVTASASSGCTAAGAEKTAPEKALPDKRRAVDANSSPKAIVSAPTAH